LHDSGRENALQGKYGGWQIVAVAENQTIAGCKDIHTGLHKRVDRQDLRSDRQDETIDKVRNRLPGYAVIIINILVAFTSVLATLLAVD
jgi:hypothetical protein